MTRQHTRQAAGTSGPRDGASAARRACVSIRLVLAIVTLRGDHDAGRQSPSAMRSREPSPQLNVIVDLTDFFFAPPLRRGHAHGPWPPVCPAVEIRRARSEGGVRLQVVQSAAALAEALPLHPSRGATSATTSTSSTSGTCACASATGGAGLANAPRRPAAPDSPARAERTSRGRRCSPLPAALLAERVSAAPPAARPPQNSSIFVPSRCPRRRETAHILRGPRVALVAGAERGVRGATRTTEPAPRPRAKRIPTASPRDAVDLLDLLVEMPRALLEVRVPLGDVDPA